MKAKHRKEWLAAKQEWWDKLRDSDIPSKRTKSSLTRPGSEKTR